MVDEVQRLPELLGEVHDLISRYEDGYRFALLGSSARKLRRLNVDLLAGRVITRRLYPLTFAELGPDAALEAILRHGLLPRIWLDPRLAVVILILWLSKS